LYTAAAWTHSGLSVTKACHVGPTGSRDDEAVVLLDALNVTERQSWPLPGCASAGLTPDAGGSAVIVVMSIGHGFPGEDPCSDDRVRWLERTSVIEGNQLRTIADLDHEDPAYAVIGW
jgi:hypothetical protein